MPTAFTYQWEPALGLIDGEGDDAGQCIQSAWPPAWTHPVTGEAVDDVMYARQAIAWVVRERLDPGFWDEPMWGHEQFLRALVGCGALQRLSRFPSSS